MELLDLQVVRRGRQDISVSSLTTIKGYVAITKFALFLKYFTLTLEKFLELNCQEDGEGMRLDAAPCQEELAQPLCQYQHAPPT